MTLNNETNRKLRALSEEYMQWCDEHKLPQRCAEENYIEYMYILSEEDRAYLRSFIRRWDEALGADKGEAYYV